MWVFGVVVCLFVCLFIFIIIILVILVIQFLKVLRYLTLRPLLALTCRLLYLSIARGLCPDWLGCV